MSIESAKALYSRVTMDETFRTQLEQTASQEERRQILRTAGYDFTQEEWDTAIAQSQALTSTDGELSEAELTAVSGGLSPGVVVPAYGVPLPNDPVFPLDDPFSGPLQPK